MKYLATLLLVTAVTADRLDKTYLPPNAQSSAGGNSGLQTPRGGGAGGQGGPQGFRGPQSGQSAQGAGGQGFTGYSGGQGSGGQGGQGGYGGQGQAAGRQGQSQGYGGQGGQGSQGGQGQAAGRQGQNQGYGGQGGQGGQGVQGQAFGGQGPQGFSAGGQGQGQGSSQNQAEILRFENEQNEQGYHYAYETSDGTKAEQQGRVIPGAQPEEGSLQVQGSYSYVGDDGMTYSVSYTADENGFRAEGAHLPTPPPIPEAILKSLELTGGGGQNQYASPKSSYDADTGYQYK